MPRPYPAEFRLRAVALVRAGKPISRVAVELGISQGCLHNWVREVHIVSRGTYGSRRVHAELTMAMGIEVSERLVAVLMSLAGIYGLPGPARVKRLRGIVTADDLVNRKFHRLHPNELWVTDITEQPTREGKVYCCAVLDTFSRKIVGWSIDSRQDSTLVVNAPDMAIRNRRPELGGIIHRLNPVSSPHGPSPTGSDPQV